MVLAVPGPIAPCLPLNQQLQPRALVAEWIWQQAQLPVVAAFSFQQQFGLPPMTCALPVDPARVQQRPQLPLLHSRVRAVRGREFLRGVCSQGMGPLAALAPALRPGRTTLAQKSLRQKDETRFGSRIGTSRRERAQLEIQPPENGLSCSASLPGHDTARPAMRRGTGRKTVDVARKQGHAQAA